MREEGSRWRRWGRRVRPVWRVVKWTAAAVLLIAVVVIVWVNVSGEAARRAVLAEMEARGLATALPLPSEDDAASADDGTRFARAVLALSDLPEEVTRGVPVLSMADGPWRGAAVPEAMAERLTVLADDTAPFRAMLERVSEYDDFRYGLRWWGMGGDAVAYLAQLRSAVHLTEALALHEQAAGRPDEAMALYGHALQLNRSFQSEPSFVMMLVSRSMSALVVNALEDALSRTAPSREGVVRVQEALREDFAAVDAARTIEWEMAFHAEHLRDLDLSMAERVRNSFTYISAMGGYRSDFDEINAIANAPVIRMPSRWRLTLATRAVEISYMICPGLWQRAMANDLRRAMADYERLQQAAGDVDRIVAFASKSGVESDGAIDVEGMLRAWLAYGARVDVTCAALEVEAFRISHGRWPTALAELEGGIPDDLYADAPLRYRRLADGVVVYGVGRDGVDDGGEQDGVVVRDGDIAFRLYDPQVRGMLRMPAPASGAEEER